MRTALLLPTMEGEQARTHSSTYYQLVVVVVLVVVVFVFVCVEDQSEAQKKLSSLLVEQLQKALQSGECDM